MLTSITLAFLAGTLAVGSAFGLKEQPSHAAWINVQLLGDETFRCVDTGLQCSEFGSTTCKIQVQTLFTNLIVPAKRDAGCISIMSDDSMAPVGLFEPQFGIVIWAE